MSLSLNISSSQQPPEPEILNWDEKMLETFLLTLFYRELLIENPVVQERLFLFVEDYLEIAKSLDTIKPHQRTDILPHIHIREQELDAYFLELWKGGLYGNPFFYKGEITELVIELVHDSEISSMKLCGDNFAFCLRERFAQAKDSIAADEWKIVSKNIFNSSEFVAEVRNKL